MALEFRLLEAEPLEIVVAMLKSFGSEEREWRNLLQSAVVTQLDEFGSVKFQTASAPTINTRDGILVAAYHPDSDTKSEVGPFVRYILFVKAKKLDELQIYKDDGTKINQHYRVASLKIET
jgi:hypothetical protein